LSRHGRSTAWAGFGNILLMNALRIAALALLASATILLVLDGLETLINSNWNGMAAGYLWSIIWPSSLSAAKSFVEGNISVTLWQRLLLPILKLPLWAHLLALGAILFFSGRKDDVVP
jgi:hypothetical protein